MTDAPAMDADEELRQQQQQQQQQPQQSSVQNNVEEDDEQDAEFMRQQMFAHFNRSHSLPILQPQLQCHASLPVPRSAQQRQQQQHHGLESLNALLA